MNISRRNDYSALFNSLPQNNQNSYSPFFGGSTGGINLSDYATIKNGSYSKLMKAYYGKGLSSEAESVLGKKPTGSSVDSAAVNTSIKTAAANLDKDAKALMATGKDSLFVKKDITTKDDQGNEKTVSDYDKDAIYKAVSSFADSYNKIVDAAGKSNNDKILQSGSNMVTQTALNERLLSSVGISVGEDNKLSVDEEKFKKANMETVKTLFNGVGSFAGNVQAKASYMNMYAQQDASKASGTYGANASYTGALGTTYNGFV